MSVIEKAVGKSREHYEPFGEKRQFYSHPIGSPVKGHVDEGESHVISLRKLGITADSPDGQRLAKEYRRIKRPLIANALGRQSAIVKDGRVMMITSALPGEGKTFTASNLAFSLAIEPDLRVLAIDADGSKSDLSRAFGVDGRVGIIDVLLNKTRVQDAIVDTEMATLKVLPSGGYHPNATELFACQRMHDLVRTLLESDPRLVIVIDSPPLIATTESQVLSALVGQVICVVRAETTTRRALKEAITLMDSEKPIGLILNGRIRNNGIEDPYGYYGYEQGK